MFTMHSIQVYRVCIHFTFICLPFNRFFSTQRCSSYNVLLSTNLPLALSFNLECLESCCCCFFAINYYCFACHLCFCQYYHFRIEDCWITARLLSQRWNLISHFFRFEFSLIFQLHGKDTKHSSIREIEWWAGLLFRVFIKDCVKVRWLFSKLPTLTFQKLWQSWNESTKTIPSNLHTNWNALTFTRSPI